MLFQELPDHLARMALFKVNTGCREQEVCGLRWDYEVKVPELETSVFIVPGEKVKNGAGSSGGSESHCPIRGGQSARSTLRICVRVLPKPRKARPANRRMRRSRDRWQL